MARKIYCQATGKWLELPDFCQRIVSFSPSVSESIIQMGLGDILKGISVYCVHPSEKIREGRYIVGSYASYKKDVIQKINPDLIFTATGYQLEFARKLSDTYPVYAVRLPLTVSDLISTCVEVGIVCGYYQNSFDLQKRLLSSLAQYVNQDDVSIKEKIKVYVEIDLGGPVTFGAYSYITDALNFVGFENIFGNFPAEWLKPEPDFVRQNEPDVIIYEPKMFRKSRDIQKIKESLISRFGDLKAIRNNRVFVTPGIYDFLAHHGPSFIYRVFPFLVEIRQKLLLDSI